MDKLKTQRRKRFGIQALWTLVTNANFTGFLDGKLYKGPLKQFCVPGLNCYSCPGALGSCPIGAMQALGRVPGLCPVPAGAGLPDGSGRAWADGWSADSSVRSAGSRICCTAFPSRKSSPPGGFARSPGSSMGYWWCLCSCCPTSWSMCWAWAIPPSANTSAPRESWRGHSRWLR